MVSTNTPLSPSLHTVVFTSKTAASSLSHDEQFGNSLLINTMPTEASWFGDIVYYLLQFSLSWN